MSFGKGRHLRHFFCNLLYNLIFHFVGMNFVDNIISQYQEAEHACGNIIRST